MIEEQAAFFAWDEMPFSLLVFHAAPACLSLVSSLARLNLRMPSPGTATPTILPLSALSFWKKPAVDDDCIAGLQQLFGIWICPEKNLQSERGAGENAKRFFVAPFMARACLS
jgi:hypothetical protein